MNKFWSSLKSGTDIRGIAVEGVPGDEINLTDEVVETIGNAFSCWICKKINKTSSEITISIGRDSRISGERILNTLVKVFLKSGFNIINCGLSSTPAMFMTTINLNTDAAIQITASHHPFNRNGLKFFTKNGGLESSDIVEILYHAENKDSYTNDKKGTIQNLDFMKQYSKELREIIKKEINSDNYDKPLDGFKIVVDAGNGAGGFYANDVLKPLGADISGSQFLDPDGYFPNHIPNPENSEAMKSISNAVIKNKADLGIIFDTDVDRGGAVNSDGLEINRNRLIALASYIALNGEKGTIVTDSVTSDGLKTYIENTLHGKHHRFKRGYKNVINEAKRLNSEGVYCPLAIETSGHAAMKENYFLDDGAYLCTKIIILAANLRKENRTINDLLKELKEPKESIEKRFKINCEDFREYGNMVIDNLNAYAKLNNWIICDNNYEGIRINFDKENGDGWALLRLSVHDPLMPLNIESNIEGGSQIIYNKILQFINKMEYLSL